MLHESRFTKPKKGFVNQIWLPCTVVCKIGLRKLADTLENSKFYPILQDMVTTAVHFTSFYDTLNQAIADSWKQEEDNGFITALAHNLQQLSDELILFGDEQSEVLQQTSPDQLLDNKEVIIFHYQWIDAAKSFLVLWRNILFENQKALILHLDKKLTSVGLQQLRTDSHTSLNAAAENLKRCFEKIDGEINKHPKGALSQLKKWHRQDSPWSVYRQQLTMLKQQAEGLLIQSQLLNEVHRVIKGIQQLTIESVHKCQAEIHTHTQIAEESTEYIGEQLDKQTGKISVFLENQEGKILSGKHNLFFNPSIEENISQLSIKKMAIAIRPHAGMLQTKEIDFKRDISQWLDAEILPVLMEVWELTTNVRNNLKMALINIRNRAILLHNDHKEGQESPIEKDDLCQPLHSFLHQNKDIEKELESLHQIIHERINGHFQLSNLYDEDNLFLSLHNQSTLTQLRSNRNELVDKAIVWWKRQQKRGKRWLSSVQEEDALSTSEKIVRFLQSRSPKTSNQSYNGIFLTKGYIGESFWVGRQQELKRIGSVIRQWEKGYRGAVMLTANRFAGKSLFGDLVSNRYFAQTTVRLLPNSTIKLNGRTFTTTYNLGEALEFVSKHSVHTKVLVWLDDLELWHDPSQPISQDIQQLLQHIDHHFGRIFYLVSLSTHLKKQLDKSHSFSRSFQAEIKLNTMSQEAIHKAILIRHGATHKQLVNNEGTEITPFEFKKMTTNTYRSSHSNIGEALNLWSCSIQPKDDEHVIYRSPTDYVLPDFLEADSALILRILFLEKRTTEYRLRKRFGPAFNLKYADALLRLQSTGLIKRQIDGWLEINELAANEILRLLEGGGYL